MTPEIKEKIKELSLAVKMAMDGDFDTYDIAVARVNGFLDALKMTTDKLCHSAAVAYYAHVVNYGE